MADENSLLGTTGKEALPFDYQVQEQQLARKRALAQMMLQKGMQPVQGQMFGNHYARVNPLTQIIQALQGYMGQRGVADADAEQLAFAKRAQEDQQGQMSGAMDLVQGRPPEAVPTPEGSTNPAYSEAGVAPDIKGGIATAMRSQWPQVRAYGQQQEKDMQARLLAMANHASQINPKAGVEMLRDQNPNTSVEQLPVAPTQFQTSPGGAEIATTKHPITGVLNTTPLSRPNFPEVKVTSAVDVFNDQEAAKTLAENRKVVAPYANSLAGIRQVIDQLNKGARTGGGESVLQGARKVAQMFGVDIPMTGVTDNMRSLLGTNMLAEARKVAPVTQNDVDMINKLVGSIDTDPKALREIMSFMEARYRIALDQHNSQVETARSVSSGSPTKYEAYRINTRLPELPANVYGFRVLQHMKQAGHDMDNYMVNGEPASGLTFDINQVSSTAPKPVASGQVAPPAGFKQRPGR